MFARYATLQQRVLFFCDGFQAPVAQDLAVAGGQAQWQQLAADAAQGVQLFESTFEARVD